MLKKILLRTYQKTAGTSRLFTTVPVPPGTVAIFLTGTSISEDTTISEYINQKKLGTFQKMHTTNLSGMFASQWETYLHNIEEEGVIISLGFLGKGGEIYSFAQSFYYDIEYTSAVAEGVQFFALVETTAVKLPYVIRPVMLTIPISSSILTFELKGFFHRKMRLAGGQGPRAQFTIFRNNDVVYETNSVGAVEIKSNYTTQTNNINDKFICKLSGISGNPTHLEIIQYVPIVLSSLPNPIGPINPIIPNPNPQM